MSAAPMSTFADAVETGAERTDCDRPNVVFIFADDWGWGDLSCHGHKAFRTPNLDKLASQGTDFTEFTVANPVCSPSRTAVMTGHYPARHGIHRHFWHLRKNQEFDMPDWLDPELVMLPRLFQQAGYRTGHFGKWHLCGRGYSGAPAPAAYGYHESAVYGGPGPTANAATSSAFDKAIDFLRANRESPFFLNLWIHETHTPHFPKERHLKAYADLNERQRVYAAVVAEADEGVGRVLDTLDELGVSDNTLVIFSSDNGPEQPSDNVDHKQMENGLGLYYSVGSAGGLKGRKRSLYEGGIRVPFLVRWPGKTPAETTNSSTVITAVDLLPTLCAAASIALPPGYSPDGENLLDTLLGQSAQRTKPIFWEWTGPESAGWSSNPEIKVNWARLGVRDGNWKLLTDYEGDRKELYRVHRDRAESRNVADRHPEVVNRLTAMARRWKEDLPSKPPEHCCSPDRAR